MKNFQIIGVDVSKSTLDVYLHTAKIHFQVDNSNQGMVELLGRALSSLNCKPADLMICFENTGKYSKLLSVMLDSQNIKFLMLSALEIKKSLGLTRGKNDKIDAMRIANYAIEKREKLKPTILPGVNVDRIKALLSLREKLVRHRTAYKNGLSDLKDCYVEGENALIVEVQLNLISELDKQIQKVEDEIRMIIQNDELLEVNYNLAKSVVGVGPILAAYLIAFTNNFINFDNPRSFACFAGIAPFSESSGKQKGNARVHPYANKQLKSLLNMGAMSAIRIPGELKNYYLNREKAGKNNMSTLNIIRNKIVFRVFAVVKRKVPYINHSKFAA
jgi:transposase